MSDRRIFPATRFVVMLLGALCVYPARALHTEEDVVLRERVFVPDPATCKRHGICDLKRVTFRLHRSRSPDDDDSTLGMWNTGFYAAYETRTTRTLTKYVFVQFIRGCVFLSRRDANGVVVDTLGIARINREGGMMTFRHPFWEIDSYSLDPVYSSDTRVSSDRHYFAQWHPPGRPWKHGFDANIWGIGRPSFPELFITDDPVPAYRISKDEAKNVSLEFRTCLYRERDVPRYARGVDELRNASPIVCETWQHNFIWDFGTERMTSPRDIAPVCFAPLTPEEEGIDRMLRKR